MNCSCGNPKLLKHLDVSKIESDSTKIVQSRQNVLSILPLCYQLYSTERNLEEFTWYKLTAWMPTWCGTWGKVGVSNGGIISTTQTSWWKLTCPAFVKHLYISTSEAQVILLGSITPCCIFKDVVAGSNAQQIFFTMNPSPLSFEVDEFLLRLCVFCCQDQC